MTDGVAVGIIANPASARDIRRLVTGAAAVTTHDKVNIVKRVLSGLGSVGVDRVISMTDLAGISAGLNAAVGLASNTDWPMLEFVDHEVQQGPADTVAATQAFVAAGVGAIVVLGGDGTNQLAARHCHDVPLVPISTGTNNTFPRPVEPTVAGIAAGLVATGQVATPAVTVRAKGLVVSSGSRTERAIVDVAITSADGLGAGAIWDPKIISELFLCFAEPHAIGLSAIGGHARPVTRTEPRGLALRLGEPATTIVRAPIGPGLVAEVPLASISTLEPGQGISVRASSGTVALDGERTFVFGPDTKPTVTLFCDGPLVVDVVATLELAASAGALSFPD